jgi:hypothetical protein
VEAQEASRRSPQQMPSGLRPPPMMAMRHTSVALIVREQKGLAQERSTNHVHHWFNIHLDFSRTLSHRSLSKRSSSITKFNARLIDDAMGQND